MPNVDKSDAMPGAMAGELDVVLRSIFGGEASARASQAISGEYIAPGNLGADAGMSEQEAVNRVAAEFKSLVTLAQRLITLHRGYLPAESCTAYNAAVAAYRTLAQQVFTQVLQNGAQVIQTVYNLDGTEREKRPIFLAQPGNVVTGIVMPPTFVCGQMVQPTTTTIQGFGWGPLLALAIAGGLGITIIAAGAAIRLINWPDSAAADVIRAKGLAEIKNACMEKNAKLPFEQQMKACYGEAEAAKAAAQPLVAAASGKSPWSWTDTVVLVLGVLGAGAIGGYLLFRYTSSAERARRENIARAKAYALRLKREGKRAITEAKRATAKPFEKRYSKSEGDGGGYPTSWGIKTAKKKTARPEPEPEYDVPEYEAEGEEEVTQQEGRGMNGYFGAARGRRSRDLTVSFKRCTCT
jgi:hypothetical protein